MKKILYPSVVVILLAMFIALMPAVAEAQYTITVDGEEYILNTPPVERDGQLFVRTTEVGEALGLVVSWTLVGKEVNMVVKEHKEMYTDGLQMTYYHFEPGATMILTTYTMARDFDRTICFLEEGKTYVDIHALAYCAQYDVTVEGTNIIMNYVPPTWQRIYYDLLQDRYRYGFYSDYINKVYRLEEDAYYLLYDIDKDSVPELVVYYILPDGNYRGGIYYFTDEVNSKYIGKNGGVEGKIYVDDQGIVYFEDIFEILTYESGSKDEMVFHSIPRIRENTDLSQYTEEELAEYYSIFNDDNAIEGILLTPENIEKILEYGLEDEQNDFWSANL